MKRGNLDEAIEHLTRATEITPDRPDMHTALGFALVKSGDARKAEAEFRAALHLEPENGDAHLGLANALQLQNRRSEADAEEGLLRNLAQACFDRGNLFHAQGHLDEALEQFTEAARLAPDFADAYVGMGLALKDQGKIGDAIQAYKQAIRIQPDMIKAHNNLAVAWYLRGNYIRAWKEVHASRQYGGEIHPDFLQVLSSCMPDPEAKK